MQATHGGGLETLDADPSPVQMALSPMSDRRLKDLAGLVLQSD
jgi:hypothetical protein